MPFTSVALEFVPPTVADGAQNAVEDAGIVLERSRQFGIEGQIRHLMIPGMIDEEEDRPVPMRPRMDPLQVWQAVKGTVPAMDGLCTQVTSFLDGDALTQRFRDLRQAGICGVILVGVPRTMQDGEGTGVAPTDALAQFRDICVQANASARNIAVIRLRAWSRERRRADQLVDPGQGQSRCGMKLRAKQKALLDLYKRCVDGVRELGFPLSIHLEAPYGFSKPAFETFARMLDYWAPHGLLAGTNHALDGTHTRSPHS